jgi:hypothetical protein
METNILAKNLKKKAVKVFGTLEVVGKFQDGFSQVADKVNGITIQTLKANDTVV